MNDAKACNEANEISDEDLEAAAEIYNRIKMEERDFSKIRALTPNMLEHKIQIAERYGWTRRGRQYADYFPGEQAKGKILIAQEMKKEKGRHEMTGRPLDFNHSRMQVDAAIRNLWLALKQLHDCEDAALNDEDVNLWAVITKHRAVQESVKYAKEKESTK